MKDCRRETERIVEVRSEKIERRRDNGRPAIKRKGRPAGKANSVSNR